MSPIQRIWGFLGPAPKTCNTHADLTLVGIVVQAIAGLVLPLGLLEWQKARSIAAYSDISSGLFWL